MWNLLGTRAVWSDALLSAEINVANPAAGVALNAVSGAVPRNDYRFLKILPVDRAPLAAPVECYVRGQDLVALYEPLPGDRVQPQIYWRATATGGAVGIEAVVSAQTSLLDSDPAFAAACEMAAGEVYALNADGRSWSALEGRTTFSRGEVSGGFLIRPGHYRWSYFEAVHPADFLTARLELAGERAVIHQRLFRERLEKGVIRRGRIAAWFLPREGDEALAADSWQNFRDSAPPLTT